MAKHTKFLQQSGVYRIKNIITDECYIGSTTNLNKRKVQHFTKLRNKYHPNQSLQNAFDLYGEQSFTFEVLIYCSNNRLKYNEKKLVLKLHPEYNVYIWEPERLQIIRKSLKVTKGELISYKAKRRKELNNALFGENP